MTSSISSNIELNSLDANKGAALKTLCGLLGVGIEETLTFGDGSNDLTMLSAAGTGAAMLNASDKVKAAADIVTERTTTAPELRRLYTGSCRRWGSMR